MIKGGPISPRASLADLAAQEFAPWTSSPGSWTPPTNAEWAALANPRLVSVRLAWLMVHKTKAELMRATAELGDGGASELIRQIGRSADWFEGLQKLLASAECRMMCALAS